MLNTILTWFLIDDPESYEAALMLNEDRKYDLIISCPVSLSIKQVTCILNQQLWRRGNKEWPLVSRVLIVD